MKKILLLTLCISAISLSVCSAMRNENKPDPYHRMMRVANAIERNQLENKIHNLERNLKKRCSKLKMDQSSIKDLQDVKYNEKGIIISCKDIEYHLHTAPHKEEDFVSFIIKNKKKIVTSMYDTRKKSMGLYDIQTSYYIGEKELLCNLTSFSRVFCAKSCRPEHLYIELKDLLQIQKEIQRAKYLKSLT